MSLDGGETLKSDTILLMNTFFAHAGEHHETAAEAAQHAAGITITPAAIFWFVLLVAPLFLFLSLHFLKCSLATKLLVVSSFLIGYSVVSYQHPGIYSAVALSIGFGIVLVTSIAGLMSTEK